MAILIGMEVKTPLLESGRRLSRRNSVNSLRNDFVARLPEKLRPVLDDVESPCQIHFSKAKAILTKGIGIQILFVKLFGN